MAECKIKVLAIADCDPTVTTFCKVLPYSTYAQLVNFGSTTHCGSRPSQLKPIEITSDDAIIINDHTVVIREGHKTERTITFHGSDK